jgi:antibiotic biosynthesis monooxygenase (ABM) superfamily enzyme
MKWRMALTTWIGLYPVVVALGHALSPLGLPALLQQAVTTAASVCVLTWVVMPVLMRWLHPWLYPQLVATPHRVTSPAGAAN